MFSFFLGGMGRGGGCLLFLFAKLEAEEMVSYQMHKIETICEYTVYNNTVMYITQHRSNIVKRLVSTITDTLYLDAYICAYP